MSSLELLVGRRRRWSGEEARWQASRHPRRRRLRRGRWDGRHRQSCCGAHADAPPRGASSCPASPWPCAGCWTGAWHGQSPFACFRDQQPCALQAACAGRKPRAERQERLEWVERVERQRRPRRRQGIRRWHLRMAPRVRKRWDGKGQRGQPCLREGGRRGGGDGEGVGTWALLGYSRVGFERMKKKARHTFHEAHDLQELRNGGVHTVAAAF